VLVFRPSHIMRGRINAKMARGRIKAAE
jgi:hypothetical protein